jgi:hypothetical protein
VAESADWGTVLKRNPDAAFRIYDGQATIVLPSRSYVHVLNETGSSVWDRIDGRTTLGQIRDAVLDERDVPRETLEADILEFVTALRSNGMVS